MRDSPEIKGNSPERIANPSPEQAQAKQDVQAVPEGFVLVPKELDGDRLHDAWRAAVGKLDHAALRHVYATMIASPTPGAAPPVQGEPLDERLHKFVNAAAGEGYVLDGVDATDLYVELFPERYAAAIRNEGGK